MKHTQIIPTFLVLILALTLVLPSIASAASGRGLFKDMYCAVLSLVNKECEVEIDGIRIKVRAESEQGLIDRAQAAVSNAFSRIIPN